MPSLFRTCTLIVNPRRRTFRTAESEDTGCAFTATPPANEATTLGFQRVVWPQQLQWCDIMPTERRIWYSIEVNGVYVVFLQTPHSMRIMGLDFSVGWLKSMPQI